MTPQITSTRLQISLAFERLRLHSHLFRSFLTAGLFGEISDNSLDLASIESFEKYGTQWFNGEHSRELKEVPFAFHESIGEQPLGTRTKVYISRDPNGHELAQEDEGWVAQFYLQPNRYFFPNQYGFSTNGPIGLSLSSPIMVSGAPRQTFLYPGPDGKLAMIFINGGSASNASSDDEHKVAYDIATAVLDQLALKYDQPLHVCQTIFIGVPSGMISLEVPRPPQAAHIEAISFDEPSVTSEFLYEALSLYREGLNSSIPFYQFLAFWKCYENVVNKRLGYCNKKGWSKDDARRGDYLRPEVFEEKFAFEKFGNKKFGKVKSILEREFRDPIAHGSLSNRSPKTGRTSTEYTEILGQIPVIRYMAKITLTNFQNMIQKYGE